MNLSSLCVYQRNPVEADCSLATLYNNGRPGENANLFFFLIVFTLAFSCAWKTGRFSGFLGRLRPAFALAAKEQAEGLLWFRSRDKLSIPPRSGPVTRSRSFDSAALRSG
jgi:hypothetical protein